MKRNVIGSAVCLGAALVLAGCGGGTESFDFPNGGVVRYQESGSGDISVAICLEDDQACHCCLSVRAGPYTVADCLRTYSGGEELLEQLDLPESAAGQEIQCIAPEHTGSLTQADGYGVVVISYAPDRGEVTREPVLMGWEEYPSWAPPYGSAEAFACEFDPFQWEEK